MNSVFKTEYRVTIKNPFGDPERTVILNTLESAQNYQMMINRGAGFDATIEMREVTAWQGS